MKTIYIFIDKTWTNMLTNRYMVQVNINNRREKLAKNKTRKLKFRPLPSYFTPCNLL